jgi:alpha-N-arabinofuranosidase
MRLCRLVGAEPYLAANVGSGGPQEFHDWVSYCNAPPGTLSLADERAANGDKEPFNVKYWGVGNESWGCGGNMTGGEYATGAASTSRRCTTSDVVLWPRGRADTRRRRRRLTEGFAGCKTCGAWASKSTAAPLLHRLRQTAEDVRSSTRGLVRRPAQGHPPREDHQTTGPSWPGTIPSTTRGSSSTSGATGTGAARLGPDYILSQTITLRDALHAAMTFDIFNRHADKIEMANVAQTINCLHSLFAATGDRYTRTPAYYTFEMYRPHMGGRLVPARISVPEMTVPLLEGSGRLPGLSGSASVRDRTLTVTLTNPSLRDGATTGSAIGGARRRANCTPRC